MATRTVSAGGLDLTRDEEDLGPGARFILRTSHISPGYARAGSQVNGGAKGKCKVFWHLMELTIWYISKYASPPGSGGGQRGISLAQNFVALGHRAMVISSHSNHQAVIVPKDWKSWGRGFDAARFRGVTMLLHRTSSYRKTVSVARAISWLSFEWGLLRLPLKRLPAPTHIIVSSLSLFSILNGYRLAQKTRSHLIFEIRDIWPLTLEEELNLRPSNLFVRVLRKIERFGYGKSAVVVGTMPNLVEHVHEVCSAGVRVETIGLGIDGDLEKLSSEYSPPPFTRNLIVGYAGSIGRTNSLEIFLETARNIGPLNGIEFELWGSGDLLEKFKRRYAGEAHIRFHGRLSREELHVEVTKGHVFFLAANDSRRWRAGQSLNKLVEYMALGRPVIAAYSGYRSMIDEAECGVFVPFADANALETALLKFRDLPRADLEKMGMKGRKWILAHRNYRTLAEDYLAILDSLTEFAEVTGPGS
ncbi:glycosyltransferase family 4 protein [Pontimonas sp.]|nr:glycosyltransferase family 4 protein [Pontimonas sp.]MDA8909490.1 glycosyltransferase family 4 protein [Pontimonas sp.]